MCPQASTYQNVDEDFREWNVFDNCDLRSGTGIKDFKGEESYFQKNKLMGGFRAKLEQN